ncbi:MAG: acyl-CoA thioesterase [Pirellulales bacterium]|nr:acyl-CoA thioesterase [Pirellulales bacterium]
MPEPFRTTRLVEFHDTDMAGIMHFASFLVYMESAEHELYRSLGMSIHSIVEDEHISFPRVSASCEFFSPARCEDVLDIAVGVTRIGNKSVSYEFRFAHAGRDVAQGQITAVCCRVRPGQPPESRPIPAEIKEKLRAYLVT